jgi:hypothetical protein
LISLSWNSYRKRWDHIDYFLAGVNGSFKRT